MTASTEPVSSAIVNRLCDQVQAACAEGRALRIHGGDSKAWYGNPVTGEGLDCRPHRGIVSYDPAELVITARCGTPLQEIEAALAASGQMLPFEPPHFSPDATLGGCVAAGLAGPRRAYCGAIRDFVLGATILNGRAEVLRFGGQVIKNVAGYDVARLMAGSLGTLGVLLDLSIRVLPVTVATQTLRFIMDENQAIETMNHWAGKPVPLSATAWHNGELLVRLSGSRAGVAAAAAQLGGDLVSHDIADAYWLALRERTDAFFAPDIQSDPANQPALWRIAVPPASPALALRGEQWLEWGGGQRWWRTDEAATDIRRIAQEAGGHATVIRHGLGTDPGSSVFAAQSAAMNGIQRRLKAVFDPVGIFNPHRIDPAW